MQRTGKKRHNTKPKKQRDGSVKSLTPKNKIPLHIWAALIATLILAGFLNTGALDWGQTGYVSWSPDSIEGRITAIYLPFLFKKWTHKYPRGQYLVSSIFYKPKIDQWKKNPIAVKMANGKTGYTPFNQKRFYELATISRVITVFMSLGILVAVFLTGRKLFDDNAAGILSALCLTLSCHFMFYSQSACVDIPAFFWFAWAGCFGLYAIKSNNLFFYLLAGFCTSWSVCTKESVATFHVGLALALAVLLIQTKMKEGAGFGKSMLSLLNWKVMAAVALAVLVFVTLEGMWVGLDEWHHRSQFWTGVVQKEFLSKGRRFSTLINITYIGLFEGWGRPLLILLALSLVYWIIRYRWQLCLTVVPFLGFFFLTVCVIGQNLPRFMMCGYAGIAILMGKTLADWYRFKRIPLVVRHILPLLVLVPSFICCVCFNLEMNRDTRVRAEEYMKTFAKSQATVGLSTSRGGSPRVWLDGFRTIPMWSSEGVMTQQGMIKIRPDYIISSDQWFSVRSPDKSFYFDRLHKGKTEYEEQARFDRLISLRTGIFGNTASDSSSCIRESVPTY
ncbi:MAG: hypothetical protein FVQ79_05060 [Planctomycetes bacterium]|nr:hypothetical protein [Planctomycetota bacterium]